MDRLDAMEMFLAAVNDGSLASAARRLGRSAAAATRAVVLLENEAGEPLLLRSTRGLRLTAAGERHVAVWRDVLDQLADVRGVADARVTAGTLVVTAPELFGRQNLMPILNDFLDAHPKVQARILLLNRLVDLVGEGIDVAVRLAPLPDTSLIAVKVGTIRRIVCASPAYLASTRKPKQPHDLKDHVCIGLSPDSNVELWPFRRDAHGQHERSVQVRTRLALNSAAACLDAARRGHGVVQALSYQVAEDIASGRLTAMLTEYEAQAVPVSVVFRAHPRRWSPTRSFVDHAVPRLRQALDEIGRLLS